MKIIKILLVLIVTLAISIQGQSQMKKANKLYDYFNYSEAIPLYLKVTENSAPSEKVEATQKLANCYRLINNIPEAKNWYKKVVAQDNFDPINYFHLGQSLRGMELYEEAAEAFKSFNKLLPDSLDGEKHYQFCIDIQPWLEIPPVAEIKNVETVNTRYSDFGPALYKKGFVFTSDRTTDVLDNNRYGWTNRGYLNLYYTEPEHAKSFWSATSEPKSMSKNFNQSYHDGPACFTSDESKVFITKTVTSEAKKGKDRIRTYLLKIFYAEINDDKKLRYQPFFLNSDEYSVGHPTLSTENDMIIFSSDMPGGFGGSDLYMCKWDNGRWGEAQNLGENINTPGNEVFPYLSSDSVLYFSSDGHLGFGGLDILKSSWEENTWSEVENLKKPINSSYDDFGIILSDNQKEGYLSSNRPEGKGSDDIYAFRMNKKVTPPLVSVPLPKENTLKVSGYVKDRTTLEPLENATVFFFNPSTDNVEILKTDEKGYYETQALYNRPYVIKAMKKRYIEDCSAFRTTDEKSVKEMKVPQDLLLMKLEVNQVFQVENIYYDLDKWYIRPDAEPPLDNLVQIMKQYPISAELSSHTDCRASHAYNIELSQKRAESAVRYIVLKGIDPARLKAKGYGETNLINHCSDGVDCTEAEHQANRRTEFKITSVDTRLLIGNGFDPDLFHEGDVIKAKTLDVNFFSNCLSGKKVLENSQDFQSKMTQNVDEPEEVLPLVVKEPNKKEFVKSEDVAEETKPNNLPSTVFRVQLIATSRTLDEEKQFLNIEDVIDEVGISVQQVGGLNKYQVGNFETTNEANNLKNELRQRGYKNCFVTKIKFKRNN